MLTAVLIEDDLSLREGLGAMIRTFCPNVEVVGEAGTVKDGVQLLTERRPKIAFLDIELPDGHGIQIAQAIQHLDIAVIFVTAHHGYAAKAFELCALDYLLKPVDPDKLTTAVEKVRSRQALESWNLRLDTYGQNETSDIKKLVLKGMESYHVVRLKEIVACEAEGSYTTFVLDGGDRVTVSKNLKYNEALLPKNFLRCHRSFVVNMDHVKRYDKRDGGTIVMENGLEIPVSDRRRSALIEYLENL